MSQSPAWTFGEAMHAIVPVLFAVAFVALGVAAFNWLGDFWAYVIGVGCFIDAAGCIYVSYDGARSRSWAKWTPRTQ